MLFRSAVPAAGAQEVTKEHERPTQKAGQVAPPENPFAPESTRIAAAKPSSATASAAETERAQSALSDEVWVVGLGTFANPDNARQLQARLGAVGVKSISEVLKAPDGEKIRVRAGPFKTKAEAEKARESLKAGGIDAGAVTPR